MTKSYITDFGQSFVGIPQGDGTPVIVDRYAAWQWSVKGRYEVVDVSDDLEKLQKKYGPCEVYQLPKT